MQKRLCITAAYVVRLATLAKADSYDDIVDDYA